jgi:hypothetical protein
MILVRFLDLKFLHARAAILVGTQKSTARAPSRADGGHERGGTRDQQRG